MHLGERDDKRHDVIPNSQLPKGVSDRQVYILLELSIIIITDVLVLNLS